MAFDLCPVTKYICAFCGDGHCGIGILVKDKITKKKRIENDIKLMKICPKEKEENVQV